eukprot:CAMPEP_0184204030 /NCGR_PEP_ID=MMETSP0976-20121227/9361_1 /TAXON_ID=483370 /ORGANISM="non described non described, Strain CCMP2097" /LENGTH=61 /DNA_ID=CAMNT_0026508605 /DNA_START=1 /DNA_END=182 /DNA_ORIENTATION=+
MQIIDGTAEELKLLLSLVLHKLSTVVFQAVVLPKRLEWKGKVELSGGAPDHLLRRRGRHDA